MTIVGNIPVNIIVDLYNQRLPPKESKAIADAYIGRNELSLQCISMKLWPDTMSRLEEWAGNHGVTDNLTNVLYTYACIVYGGIKVTLFIKWSDLETQTLFDLSTNFY
jgi:hypothetical protein